MYEKYFGFKKKPFSLTPDPEFFFISEDHYEALEHLIYGISEGEGFMLLVGGIGTGKTTLSRVLVDKLSDSIIYSLILNPFQDFNNLLKNILWDFGVIPDSNDIMDMRNQLIEFLLNEVAPKGKTALIIIDESQNLSNEVLEQLRVISNIETDKEKLVQILLLGQEELIVKLESNELRQLKQRITIRYFLSPLRRKEIKKYIEHRIEIGEPTKRIKFDWMAIREIYKFSKGIPRKVNMIASRCLLGAFVKDTTRIDYFIVKKAIKSLYGEKLNKVKKYEKKQEIDLLLEKLPEEEKI